MNTASKKPAPLRHLLFDAIVGYLFRNFPLPATKLTTTLEVSLAVEVRLRSLDDAA